MSFEQQMQQAMRSFIVEAQELLEGMERGLMELDQPQGDPAAQDDGERINALFRAAHTIKGSAGLFGLDGIVRFTHHLESVLDQMRADKLAVSPELVALLLQGRDHLAQLVDQVDSQGSCISDTPQEQALVARLQAAQHAGGALVVAAEAVVPVASATDGVPPVTVLAQGAALTASWHLSLRFGADSLRNGMDPLAFIRYLRGLGDIVGLVTLTDALPPLDVMDAETSYLGFEINFKSEASKEDIAAVFEFVQEDSIIRILPAHSRIADYVELIRTLPEDDLRLGDILVQIGTLTQKELTDALSTQQDAQATGSPASPLGEILVREGATHQPIVQAALDKQKQVKDKRSRDSQMLRVAADKLDALINLVGELVIASAGNALHAQNATQTEAAAQVTRLVEDIRERALKLRMVEIGETFARFQRLVRDVSRELGKDIALVIEGADTEMDKTLVERIADPLMHLVRNSMDHGIESPDVRQAAGKTPVGTLTLRAFHQGGSIVVEIEDDGAGLHQERILRKAIERGLTTATATNTEQQIFAFIFAAGFSTAEKVTDLSGRGVGLDVVRRNLERLRGCIDIDSAAGRGTRFKLTLPLTLAIIDGLIVRVGEERYVIPTLSIRGLFRPQPDIISSVHGNAEVVNVRGRLVPLLRLREFFGVDTRNRDISDGIVIVVQAGTSQRCLLVDATLHIQEVVIKSLNDMMAHKNRALAGAAILGDGRVGLILDVNALVQLEADSLSEAA